MYGKRFIIGDVLGFGWRVMKANLWFFVGLGLVAGGLMFLPGLITGITERVLGRSEVPEEIIQWVSLPITVLGWCINIIIAIGFIKIALSFCDGRKPAFDTLFDFRGCFWRYVGTHILYLLIVFGGLLLFIVPGIIWAVKYGLCYYFVVDKGLGPIQALKASGRTTMGVKWLVFGFAILCILIIYAGLLCLVVGLFAAYPIVLVAKVLMYRHLVAQTPELAEFGIGVPAAGPVVEVVNVNANPYQQPPQQMI